MRALARSAKSIGDGRVNIRALQIERQKIVQRLRAKAKKEDQEKKQFNKLVKLCQAEAEIAKAKGKECAAEAK